MRKVIMRKQYKHTNRERGQSLVEAAFALPVVIMLMLGLLDLGRAYYIMVELNDAADEAATYAALKYTDISGIRMRAVQSANNVTIDPDNVVLSGPPAHGVGQPVTVTISVDMSLYTPFVSQLVDGEVLHLHGEAIHPIIMLP
jgi:Flp pilus assembly protein TadG